MHPGYPPPPPPGYGYPPGYYPPGMVPPGYGQPVRPSSPKTLGVLSIVFGSLAAAGTLFGLVTSGGSVFRPSGVSSAAWRHYLDQVGTVTMIMSAVMLAMSVALIVIGAGQRGYKRWAGKASVWWALAGLVILAIQLVVNLTVVAPAMERVFADLPRMARETANAAGKVSAFLALALYVPYPIILLVTFRKPAVVAAMDQE